MFSSIHFLYIGPWLVRMRGQFLTFSYSEPWFWSKPLNLILKYEWDWMRLTRVSMSETESWQVCHYESWVMTTIIITNTSSKEVFVLMSTVVSTVEVQKQTTAKFKARSFPGYCGGRLLFSNSTHLANNTTIYNYLLDLWWHLQLQQINCLAISIYKIHRTQVH